MSRERILGTWTRSPPLRGRSCALEIRCVPRDLRSRCNGCGLVADFLAQFMAHDLGERAVVVNVLSTILNELVQNAAKFSADDEAPIEILLRRHVSTVHIEVANVCDERGVDALAAAIGSVDRSDPEDLFRRRVTGAEQGGLGLLLLRKDYGAIVGARLSPPRDGRVAIRVRVAVELTGQAPSRPEPIRMSSRSSPSR